VQRRERRRSSVQRRERRGSRDATPVERRAAAAVEELE